MASIFSGIFLSGILLADMALLNADTITLLAQRALGVSEDEAQNYAAQNLPEIEITSPLLA